MKTIHINRTINRVLNVISSAMLNIVSLITSRVLSSKALNVKTVTLLLILTLCSCSTFLSGRARAADVGFTVYNNNAVLELTVPSSVSLELNPTTGTDFSTVNLPIGVGTNNKTGYTLTMAASSDVLARTSSVLDGNGNTISPTIASIDSSINSSDFESSSSTINKWGYKLSSSSSYIPIPTSTTTLSTTSGPSNSTNITTGIGDINLNFAAKIDTTTPAGTYRTTLNFIAVTNALPPTINDLEYMQDFATLTVGDKTEVISSMVEGTQYQLIDNRDNKTYFIAKLQDGNVWMTQNLDLLIGGTYNDEPIILTSENTDLNQYDTNGDGTGTTFTHYTYDGTSGTITWTPTASTLTGSPATISGTTVTGWSNSQTGPYMAEGGDTYSVQGTRYNSLSACENNGARTKAQCMHYHVGNYYDFTAAVAMSSTSAYTTDNTVMPNSICPKGWRLPNGITDDNGTKIQSDFNVLLTDYGIAGSADTVGDTSVAKSDWATVGYLQMGLSPLFFARSGIIESSSLDYFGTGGYYWSSTVRDESDAYSLGYSATGLYPASRVNRGYGRSVRCMAR